MKFTLPAPARLALIIQAGFGLSAVIWLVFGLVSLFRPAASGAPLVSLVVAGLMFGNAGAFLSVGLGLGWRRGRRWAYLAGLLVLGVNGLLTITDQGGVWDYLTLALDVALFGLLIPARAHYLSQDGRTP